MRYRIRRSLLPSLALTTSFLLLAGSALYAGDAWARPERIKPGVPYYDDDYVCEKEICDLVAERNYEEVYELYSYYEATYDEAERVIRFIEYKRGEKIRTEEYSYDASGKPLQKKVTRGEGQVETKSLGQEGEAPGPI